MVPRARWRSVLLALGAFALLWTWLLVRLYDKDVWFHMLIGRVVLSRKSLPTEEFYKYPLLGQPAGFHEWGFGLLSELAHRAGGWLGLAALNAAVSAAAVLLVGAAARRRGASRTAVLLLLGPLALAASYRFQYRPETMLYLALGATLWALEANRLYLLPVFTFGLALFHPSPLILVLVSGARVLDLAVAERRLSRRVLSAAGFVALSALAVGLAPYGFHQLTLPLEFYRRGDLTRVIAEFAPALETEYRYHVVGVALAAVLGLAFDRRRRVSDLLLLGLFGYLAFAHVRNGPLFALLAFGPAAVAATRALDRLPAAAGAAATALALAAVTGVFVRSSEWGWRPYPDIFPSATADFILRHRPSGRLLNDMRSGGYLAWRLYPDYLVSVDGRTYYGQDRAMEVSDRVLGAEPGWRETVERYGVSMVATSPVNFMSGALPRVVFELDRDPAWMPVVADVTGLLFVKRSALPGALALPRERVWSLVQYLAGELAEVLPRSPEVYLTQGTASFRLHDFARAAKDFSRYCELAPGDRETAALAQKLAAAAAGDPAALLFAEALFARSGAPGP